MKLKMYLGFFIALLLVGANLIGNVEAQSVTARGSFDPATVNPQVGSEFSVKVRVNPSTPITIQLYELKLNFDRSKLEVRSISYSAGQRSANLGGDGDTTLSSVNSRGEIRLAGEIVSPPEGLSLSTGDRELAQVTFKALSASQSIVTLDGGSSTLTRVKPDFVLESVSVSDATLSVNGGVAPPPPPPPPPPPVVPATTQKVRIAESRGDLNRAGKFTEVEYSDEPLDLVYSLLDKTPGVKTLWVKFIGTDTSGRGVESIQGPFNITVLGPDPRISSLSCNLALTTGGVSFEIKGTNFGSAKGTRGGVKAGDAALRIDKWSDGLINATLNQQATDGQSFPVVLTRQDGEVSEEAICTIGVSQIQLGANLFCSQAAGRAASGVEAILAEGKTGGTSLKQTVTINSNGIVSGLKNVQEGQGYKLSIKIPKSLRRTVEFIAEKGTTEVGLSNLPVGDIFPVGGDGSINSNDYSEMIRQWIIASSPGGERSADLNGDSRVNSFDWACMRPYFNAPPDDPKPTPGPLTTITSSPAPTANPTASSSATQSL